MLSDDDDDDDDSIDVPEQIPARAKAAAKAVEEPLEDDDDEDDNGEPDEYRVEKILKHDFLDNGTPVYQIKWLGYEDVEDLTWEPVENLYAQCLAIVAHFILTICLVTTPRIF